MEIKKNPQVDAERQRIPLILLGLFLTASFIGVLFSFRSPDGSGLKDDAKNMQKDIDFDVNEMEEPPPPEDTPPPPETPEVPPPPTDDVTEVESEDDQTQVSIAPPDVKPPPVTTAPPPPPPADKIEDFAEEEPEFPGGEALMMKYLQEKIKYPEMAIQMGDQGKVFVRFVVEPDGSISNVEIARSLTPELDKEAMRVVKGMPNWKPGKNRGRAVRVRVIIPINFKLQ